MKYIVFLLESISCISCSVFESFSETEQVSLLLPAWPPTEEPDIIYPELSGWQLSFLSSEKSEYLLIPAETTCIKRTVRKNDILVVSARPVTFSCDKDFETLFFMPAGSSYPQFCRNGELQVSWENGLASEFMKIIFLNGEKDGYSKEKARDFLIRFNWKKFSEVISSKTENTDFYNPWFLDFEKTVNALSSGNFSATKLNIKTVEELPVSETYQTCPLSPYIPENQKIATKKSLPVYSGKENLFIIENNLLLKAFWEDSKKVSDTTVFMPKKTIETVYAKKN